MKQETFWLIAKQVIVAQYKQFFTVRNLFEKLVVLPILAIFFILVMIIHSKLSLLTQNLLLGCACVWIVYTIVRFVQWHNTLKANLDSLSTSRITSKRPYCNCRNIHCPTCKEDDER